MQKKYLGVGGGAGGAQGNRKMELTGSFSGSTKESGPQRFDYDEDYAVNPAHILDHSTWVPCMPLPCPLSFSERVKFKQVACGAYHTIAISEGGDAFACGLVSRGRLGLTEEQAKESMRLEGTFRMKGTEGRPMLNLYAFTQVPIPPDLEGPNRVISSAHCGYDYTLLLTLTGQVLSAGSGQYGIHCNLQETQRADQYGSAEPRMDSNERRDSQRSPKTSRALDRYQFRPVPLEVLGGHIITFVSAGEHHAAIINMNGELWTWGLNNHGQCGISIEGHPYSSAPRCSPE